MTETPDQPDDRPTDPPADQPVDQPPPYHGPVPPQESSRFKGSSIAWGCLLSVLMPLVWIPVSVAVAGMLGSGSLGIVVLILLLLVPFLPGALLTARGKTRSERGMGLGLLIGWSVFAIVGGGVCIALIRSFGA